MNGRVRDVNAAFIFEGGNLYGPSRPFVTVPAWWRRFVFAVLEPREFMVYAYIVSFMGPTPISYPTYANMKADLNLRNHNVLKRAIDALVEKGFLLVDIRSPMRIGRHARNVYQRPSVGYTIRVLPDKRYINAEWRPVRRNPEQYLVIMLGSILNVSPLVYVAIVVKKHIDAMRALTVTIVGKCCCANCER